MIPLNIMPEMCIRRDIVKKDKKVISDQILICNHADDDECCTAYPNPTYWCVRGGCPLSSLPSRLQVAKQHTTNALKASKRKARGL